MLCDTIIATKALHRKRVEARKVRVRKYHELTGWCERSSENCRASKGPSSEFRPRDIHTIYTSRRWSNSEGGAGDLIYNSISARRDVIGRSWARPKNMSSLFDGPLSQEMSSRGGLEGGRGPQTCNLLVIQSNGHGCQGNGTAQYILSNFGSFLFSFFLPPMGG